MGEVAWASAAQGDILNVEELHYVEGDSGPPVVFRPEFGVALLSQTCDLVRGRPEDRVLVAPVRGLRDPAERSDLKRGRKPLLVLVGQDLDLVAEIDRMVSVPRSRLDGVQVVQRTSASQSGEDAARLAARVARAFARFAFPDGVHHGLRRLQRKVVNGYGKNTFFAKVLELVQEFRVASENWEDPESRLTLYAIVDAADLPDAALVPRGWAWSDSAVRGLKPSEQRHEVSIERVSELITVNLEHRNDAALVELWQLWQGLLHTECLASAFADEDAVEFLVVSGDDLTYSEYITTQPLDFSTLSLATRSAA